MSSRIAKAMGLMSAVAAVSSPLNARELAPLAQWVSYLGWSFHSTNGRDTAVPTMRMYGRQGPLRFLILRRGDDYTYSLYDNSGARLIRVARLSGESKVYDSRKNLKPDTVEFASDINALVEVLTNDIASRPTVPPDSEQVAHLDIGMNRIAIVNITPEGRCISIVIHGVNNLNMMPEKVSELPHGKKFYSSWRINGELFEITDIRANEEISEAELAAP